MLPIYGFRRGHSTASALADVVDNLLVGQDRGGVSALLLLDFSRAFDTINTSLLLSKLTYYGFDAAAVRWFQSYLSDRWQIVEIANPDGSKSRSKQLAVTRGVPQGSILGPLLYALYGADIVNCITNCQFHLYADDLQLYYTYKQCDNALASNKINEDLDRITQWCQSNCLSLNPTKSKLLVTGSRGNLAKYNDTPLNISIKGEAIERVASVRNLGLIMDGQLNFESHIVECARNCFYRLKVLYKLRPYLNEKVRIMLCESLVLSKLNYCDTVYGPCILVRTEKLIQRVQNACARFCFSVPPRAHVTPFLNANNLLKMKARRQLHLASLLFGVIATGRPPYLHSKLVWAADRSKYPKRSCTHVFAAPKHHSVAFRGSFRFAATKMWNCLLPPVRDLESLHVFKIQLKKIMLNEQKCGNVPLGCSRGSSGAAFWRF